MELLLLLDGLECAGLRIGSPAAAGPAGASAVPIGIGPSDATFWIDAEGIVYDDTDLERTLPVASGAVGLLDYWLLGVGGNRWSGAVHMYVVRVAHRDPADLVVRLGLPGTGLAVGAGLAVWPTNAPGVCDAIDGARTLTPSAALSGSERAPWVAALLTLVRDRPEPVLRVDAGYVLDLRDETPIASARCWDGFARRRDGWIHVVREPGGNLDLRREL